MSGHDLSGITYQGNGEHAQTKVSIVQSKWNPEVTDAMRLGAIEVLQNAGVKPENIAFHFVPGTYELATGAAWLLELQRPDAVICIGCVIQGETRHFDFICDAAAQGIMRVSLDYQKPVIFGVLTTENQDQALARSGGALGNKGCEAAVAALEMIDLRNQFR
jgi:6,7-dimethyl-8-ribityllumazine synthase